MQRQQWQVLPESDTHFHTQTAHQHPLSKHQCPAHVLHIPSKAAWWWCKLRKTKEPLYAPLLGALHVWPRESLRVWSWSPQEAAIPTSQAVMCMQVTILVLLNFILLYCAISVPESPLFNSQTAFFKGKTNPLQHSVEGN